MTPRRNRNPFPELPSSLVDLLREAGWDLEAGPPPPELLRELYNMLQQYTDAPRPLILDAAKSKLKLQAAKRASQQAVHATEEAAGVVNALIEAKPILARLELFRDGEPPDAYCRLGNQTRAFSIHPDVDLDALRRLEPWHWVEVHPEEPVIIGVLSAPELYTLAQGDVVDLLRIDPQDPARAFVSKHEHDECVVTLAPALRAEGLQPPAKLVLQRDDERYAIASLEADEQRNRFEVSLDDIKTTLDDLAGVEDVVIPLIDDILACILREDTRRAFDLRPLKGALLYSYKPGTGKTSVVCALGAWLRDLGARMGFDVALYQVKPNELKSVWHGGDARNVRVELCGSLRHRQARPRTRPLLQIVLFDEIDSLGVRASGDAGSMYSPAQNDAVQALLAEMDGLTSHLESGDGPPAHVLWIGLSNLPDGIDGALKRPGRFGDLVVEMPEPTLEVAEGVMAIYLGRHPELPWIVGSDVRTGLSEEEVRREFLRPALAQIFGEVVLRYRTEGNREVEVTAGEILTGVHYMQAANQAKKRAAIREVRGTGAPAVEFADVLGCLVDQAVDTAGQMAADPGMMRRQLRIDGPLNRVVPVLAEQLTITPEFAPSGPRF